ncbi:MAG: hypothetical protein KC619_35830 [Myxococcales bacterium]|nr:hypothetical protein [Myxococcales bacterium]
MRPLASTILLLALPFVAGCDLDAQIATEDGGNRPSDAGGRADAGGGDAGDAMDAGGTDGGTDACVEVECPAPPDGCHYEGFDICTTCGTLVCDVMCGGATSTFPTYDRTCTDVSECVIVDHQTDCCGAIAAMGIRADEESAFDDAEALCRGMYPACGCAAGPRTADDGTTYDGSREVRVECVAGSCTTTFGLPSGAACTAPGDTCGAGLSCCYPCGIPGCDNVCEPTCDPGDPGCVDGCMLRP